MACSRTFLWLCFSDYCSTRNSISFLRFSKTSLWLSTWLLKHRVMKGSRISFCIFEEKYSYLLSWRPFNVSMIRCLWSKVPCRVMPNEWYYPSLLHFQYTDYTPYPWSTKLDFCHFWIFQIYMKHPIQWNLTSRFGCSHSIFCRFVHRWYY